MRTQRDECAYDGWKNESPFTAQAQGASKIESDANVRGRAHFIRYVFPFVTSATFLYRPSIPSAL